MNEIDAADYCTISVRTLQGYRVKGGGPLFSKIGARVIYRRIDLDSWVEANLVRSTSEQKASGK
jgi:hypothetical protein